MKDRCVYYLAISRLFIMIDRCVYYLAISRLPINQFNKKYLTKVFNIYYYLLAWFVTYACMIISGYCPNPHTSETAQNRSDSFLLRCLSHFCGDLILHRWL